MDAALLGALREARGFDVEEVLGAKVALLEGYLRRGGLDAVVLGLSGGVDSALAAALLREVQRREGSVLRRVVALLLPIEGRGATGQAEATRRGRLVAEALGVECWEAPLGGALAALVRAVEAGSGLRFDAWSEGQALSVLRTPALYGAAALLQAQGYRSLVAGTTNRDEGAWLGFFGKASDAMVDLQPLSDLHKSEVRALAARLGVPAEVLDAEPEGGVWDGRTDAQMLGASYDEAELALRCLELERDPAPHLRAEAWAALRRQRSVNAHKYAVGSPAVHFDVLPRGVPGGWSSARYAGEEERKPPQGAIAGAWEPGEILLEVPLRWPRVERLALPEGFAARARGVLSKSDCARLREAMASAGVEEPVGVTGVRGSYGVGSRRATAWSPALARELWRRLAPAVPQVRFTGERTPTEGFATREREGHRSWRVRGLSPLLRFMRYEPGGRHLCHYDAGYDYGDGRRTLLSVVFYLTDAPSSGATRFVRDGQEGTLVRERCFDDWDRDTREDEVLLAVHPAQGDALLFDHRLCHDVQRWEGPGDRVIVRGDVVYEAVPDGRG